MKKAIVVSGLTNRIYWASVTPVKGNPDCLLSHGEKIDVTDMAISAMFQYMQHIYEFDKKDQIIMPGFGSLTFEPDKEESK